MECFEVSDFDGKVEEQTPTLAAETTELTSSSSSYFCAAGVFSCAEHAGQFVSQSVSQLWLSAHLQLYFIKYIITITTTTSAKL